MSKYYGTRLFLTLTVFLTSSFAIFNPLLSCAFPVTGHFFCLITAVAVTFFVRLIFSKKESTIAKSSFLSKALSILCAIFAILCVLLFMTQVIRDTCFIVGKGVSKSYYFILSFFLLSCALSLSIKGHAAIKSFCTISVVAIILFTALCFLPFTAVKEISTDFFTDDSSQSLIQSVICGIVSGLFLAADCCAFFYCTNSSEGFNSRLTKTAVYSVLAVFFLVLCINSCVYLILGKNLTLLLSKPVYALTKCFTGFDLTEIVPAVEIFSFIIKCSFYLYAAALAVKRSFLFHSSRASKAICLTIYLCVPTIYLPFLFLGEKYSYGALQHLIYPSVAIMSLLFLFLHILEKKK